MSKFSVSLLVWASMGMSSFAFAGWQDDCKSIDSSSSSQGACAAIQSQIGALQAYSPLQPFQDLSPDGSGLSGRFPWGSPVWATGGGGGGMSDVLTNTDSSSSQGGGGSSSGSSPANSSPSNNSTW